MAAKLKRTEKATFNYTNRHKIHQKDCQITIIDRTPGNFKIGIYLDPAKVKVSEDQTLVLEAFYRLLYDRIELSPDKPFQNKFLASAFPSSANPTFRLKLISTKPEEEGRVISATTYFGATKSEDEQDTSNAFFTIRYANLEGQIWRVDWEDPENPVVMIDEDFSRKYKLQDDAMAQAFIYPPLIKEIILGVLLRFDSYEDMDERQTVAKWLKFCEQKLGMSIPEPTEDEWRDDEAALNFAELAAQKFAAQKWDGKKTLLEKFLGN